MKSTYISMLLGCVIFSCSPLKKAASAESFIPSIAAIGKKDNSLLHSNFKQLGIPNLSKPIAVSAQAIPFNKAKFRSYKNLKTRKGERVYVTYVDSLPTKPKYVHFEIKDKIGLKTLLNSDENTEVRSYLSKDSDCKMVTGISLFINEMEADMYLRAESLFLITDSSGLPQIEVTTGGQKLIVSLPKNEIFDYDVMGFCWGENTYGKPQIETLNNGGSCPQGTVKNAQKLHESFSFVKL